MKRRNIAIMAMLALTAGQAFAQRCLPQMKGIEVKVNGRPIFGKSQDDRPRYASFLATTNDEHPLCDPTGSRLFRADAPDAL